MKLFSKIGDKLDSITETAISKSKKLGDTLSDKVADIASDVADSATNLAGKLKKTDSEITTNNESKLNSENDSELNK